MSNWKQYQFVNEIPVTWSFIWTLIKKRFKKESYQMTISFYGKTNAEASITGAQLEFGKSTW